MDPEPADVVELTYEQALAELEQIVAALENEEQTLERAITLFERGQLLAQHCAGLLERAELRVRTIGDGGAPPLP